ncbi:MAG: hydrogenase maturation protease [Campylobacterales bacterium]|nr:hydrogenase maturation protease [Campylobacterales bacterium]
MKTLLIGYGNTLRGDDGFGVFVATEIEKLNLFDVVISHQLTPEMVFLMREYELILFVDSAVGVDEFALSSPLSAKSSTNSLVDHSISPFFLQDMTKQLFDKTVDILLFSILIKEFDYSEELSIECKSRACELIEFLSNSEFKYF